MNPNKRLALLFFLVSSVLLSGCDNATAPLPVPAAQGGPSPEAISGKVDDQTNFAFLKWKEGLAFMIVDGISGSWRGMTGESGSGQPDRRTGYAKAANVGDPVWKQVDEPDFEWKSESPDGKTVVFTIDGVLYDLTKGSVFRIDMVGDKASVKQIDLDLGEVQLDEESCIAFIKANPELSKPVSDSTKE